MLQQCLWAVSLLHRTSTEKELDVSSIATGPMMGNSWSYTAGNSEGRAGIAEPLAGDPRSLSSGNGHSTPKKSGPQHFQLLGIKGSEQGEVLSLR